MFILVSIYSIQCCKLCAPFTLEIQKRIIVWTGVYIVYQLKSLKLCIWNYFRWHVSKLYKVDISSFLSISFSLSPLFSVSLSVYFSLSVSISLALFLSLPFFRSILAEDFLVFNGQHLRHWPLQSNKNKISFYKIEVWIQIDFQLNRGMDTDRLPAYKKKVWIQIYFQSTN